MSTRPSSRRSSTGRSCVRRARDTSRAESAACTPRPTHASMTERNGMTHADQIAMVSGATGGIGGAVVEMLAGRGATVIMLGRNDGRLSAARERIESTLDAPTKLHTLELDINDVDSVDRGVATVLREFGQIDVLVNAAGDGPVAPLLEADEALWSQTVNGKMLGTIRMTRA